MKYYRYIRVCAEKRERKALNGNTGPEAAAAAMVAAHVRPTPPHSNPLFLFAGLALPLFGNGL